MIASSMADERQAGAGRARAERPRVPWVPYQHLHLGILEVGVGDGLRDSHLNTAVLVPWSYTKDARRAEDTGFLPFAERFWS